MLTTAYIGLGSNLGDKEANIKKALELLEEDPGVHVKKVASLYRTAPLYKPKQDMFFNTVAEIETNINPHELLKLCKDIEKRLERAPTERWGPRTIDLDLLLYGKDKICASDLVVPHPRMTERAFVMAPLAEIAPELIVPGGCKAIDLARLLLRDQFVEKLV
ncbi:2-amino-4-hydroxy-6-hydroxymethyldihydropteridine diphosphokinase [Pelotomaculum propionicicum]|uniref:2-amino-4-hydroxy-6-hydroxymethyldihydropteridine diphosphokinase n=1 Tax=Pelotomaculum propionicicum TaxID=258475 RepID=A0A4Y7RLZ3_9FIRM|nr:2-amino-4-hydroxy-6-hydroxymethyldihydropteridine diphosphokinase [Pelotomaculum propionicicum]NLI11569.1 2-amino-4-hydroxy-6-hydroxymethyldihydropteridine diphosphokinase [Peptococcaceae bacterium]TEB09702.1 2-amino-4-hydroxy-6-hydroxymethyldihydropteridine pyrophosphokinase [Pelotomaculum propionicicum]